MIYAGIGSRETPKLVCDKMAFIGRSLYKKGFILRSGKALGADQAFEKFVPVNGKELFVADDSVGRQDWHDHASRYHPAWNRCSPWAKNLHARNSAILLGENLDSPVDFVVCWTKDGKASGGTGQGLRIALDNKIKVFNLFFDEMSDELKRFINETAA